MGKICQIPVFLLSLQNLKKVYKLLHDDQAYHPPPPPFQGPVTAIFTYFILMGELERGEGADSFTTTNSFLFLAKNLQIYAPLALFLYVCGPGGSFDNCCNQGLINYKDTKKNVVI
jgi:hypothetical protein